MMKNKKDDDIQALEDDDHSLEFTLDQSIRMKGFP